MNTVDLAKDIVSLCRKHKYEFNSTKIQKLLYLFLGFALMNDAIDETNQFDELPEAWPYGPVFPTVHKNYHEIIKHNTCNISLNDEKLEQILEKTVQFWGRISATKLSEWSHKEGSPWYELIEIGKMNWKAPIDQNSIRNYFLDSVQNVLEETQENGIMAFLSRIF